MFKLYLLRKLSAILVLWRLIGMGPPDKIKQLKNQVKDHIERAMSSKMLTFLTKTFVFAPIHGIIVLLNR